MSVHVLMNSSKKMVKISNMRGLPSILSHFDKELNKFNNTGVQMLDYILNESENATLQLSIFLR